MNIPQLENKHKTFFPVLYCLLSSFLFAATALTIKLMPNVSPNQVLYMRSLQLLVVLKFIANKEVDSYPPKQIQKLHLRGLCGGIGTIMWFWAVRLIQSSEVIVLSKISPLWTALIAAYITKTDKLSCKLIVVIGICMIGVMFIARPPFFMQLLGHEVHGSYEWHLLGVTLALFSSVTQSVVQVIISNLAKSVHQIAILQYFSFYNIVIPMTYQLFSNSPLKWPSLHEWCFLAMNGLFGGLAQFFMNRCFIIGKLNRMSLIGQSQVLFSYVFDVLILHEDLNGYSIFGSVLVCLCLVIHTLQVALMEQGPPQQSIIFKWMSALIDYLTFVLQPITENKLAGQYPIFKSVPGVIFMATIIPLTLLVVFSYGMFKWITYEPSQFKYAKLPVKEVKQKKQQEYPPLSLFSFI